MTDVKRAPLECIVEIPVACPHCGSQASRVYTSRKETELTRRRYRECPDCGKRFASVFSVSRSIRTPVL